jgi:hypothetical protein
LDLQGRGLPDKRRGRASGLKQVEVEAEVQDLANSSSTLTSVLAFMVIHYVDAEKDEISETAKRKKAGSGFPWKQSQFR